MNKSIAYGCSAEDGDRKYFAQTVAERHRRWEQDRKKYVNERLLPEGSLDKNNNKRVKTKAGILKGAIQRSRWPANGEES